MAEGKSSSRKTRKQATRIALLAFVAADCAGVAYVQHRMARQAEAVEQLAYSQPLVTPAAGSPALAFAPAGPALPTATPVAATPVTAAPAVAAAPSARLAVAASQVEAAAPAAPVLGSAEVAKAPARTLRAPRIAPAAEVGAARLAVTAPAGKTAASAHHQGLGRSATPAVADSAFASAFTLDGEAPEGEHRFGQDQAATGSLADLVAPREEPAPIFDRAGIAPVTGQAAAVDAPAPAPVDAPAAATTDELPATTG